MNMASQHSKPRMEDLLFLEIQIPILMEAVILPFTNLIVMVINRFICGGAGFALKHLHLIFNFEL